MTPGSNGVTAALLLAYPMDYRRDRGAEVVSTLLDTANPGQTRPSLAETCDLVYGGIRARARRTRVTLTGPVAADAFLHTGLLTLALAGCDLPGGLGGDTAQPEAPAEEEALAEEEAPADEAPADAFRLADVPGVARLGPDPLNPAFTRDTLAGLLAGRRTQIKGVLRDQATIAGVGNANSVIANSASVAASTATPDPEPGAVVGSPPMRSTIWTGPQPPAPSGQTRPYCATPSE